MTFSTSQSYLHCLKTKYMNNCLNTKNNFEWELEKNNFQSSEK